MEPAHILNILGDSHDVGTEQQLESAPAPEQTRAKPNIWGPWATLGLSLVALVISIVFCGVLFGILLGASALSSGGRPQLDSSSLEFYGLPLAAFMLVQAAATLACLAVFIWLKGGSFSEYLGLRLPQVKTCIAWTIASFALLATLDCVTVFGMGRDIVPPVVVDDYRNAESLLALLLMLIVWAPIFEETLFRGFLFKGIAWKWGGVAAIAISTVLWTSLHIQYDLYDMGQVFVVGLFLGVVRLRTGSTLLTIALHAVNNSIATIETVIVAAGAAP